MKIETDFFFLGAQCSPPHTHTKENVFKTVIKYMNEFKNKNEFPKKVGEDGDKKKILFLIMYIYLSHL